MRIGNEDCLQGLISTTDNLQRVLHNRIGLVRFVHGAHVAKTQVRIYLDPIPYLSTQQAPYGLVEELPQNVPERDLDSGYRGHSDNAQPPEAVLLHHSHQLLDVARIAANQQRLKVLDCSGDRPRFPFARRLAPSE